MSYDEYSAEWLLWEAMRLSPDPPASALLFEAWVDVNPLPKRRPRVNTQTGHAYTPDDTRRYEAAVGWILRAAMKGRELMTGDLSVTLDFYRKDRRRADIDNYCKSLLDAANGVLYQDDKQITVLSARVVYGSATPGTRVRVKAA